VVLGKYPQQNIKEIWYSEEGKKLRDHLEHNDLSNGCKHCLHYLEKKKFSGLKPLVFDQYSDYKNEQMPKVLEFSLENTCNLECIMCSGDVSSSIRKNRDKLPPLISPYDDAFVDQLEEFIPHAREAKFYGGEPFMTPIYFNVWDRIYKLNKNMKLFTITNGTKLNTRIKEVLERQAFEIAVSIDGYTKETYSKIRKNADFDTVMKNLDYFNKYCLNNGYPLTISFTAMRNNWRELPQMLQLCNKLKAHIYISYVHKPYDLALWNLPSADLAAMIRELKSFSLPLDSFVISYKKYNKQAYNDFITYLEGCYEKNVEDEAKKNHAATISNSTTEVAKVNTTSEVAPHITLVENSKALFSMRLEEYQTQATEESIASFNDKISALYDSSGITESVFYTLLLLAPIGQIVSDVIHLPLADLVQLIAAKAQEVK
jgi:MoaA/NifB/PqqE/SkfB family radical SAM enzyme